MIIKHEVKINRKFNIKLLFIFHKKNTCSLLQSNVNIRHKSNVFINKYKSIKMWTYDMTRSEAPW
jgi:hypothetical protein